MRHRLLLTFSAIALSITTALAPSAASANAAPNTFKYAALGDSFSAGYGLDATTLLSGDKSVLCQRSSEAYPFLLAEDGSGTSASALQFVACSGAYTTDLLKSQTTAGGPVPPQVSALSPTTKTVTLTIGGNDAGFGYVAACLPQLGEPGCTLPDIDARVEGALGALAGIAPYTISDSGRSVPVTSLVKLFAAIQAKAPHAHIYVAGYPVLFASCTDQVHMLANGFNVQLNGIIQRAADTAGVTYVNVAPVFDGPLGVHDVCTGPSSWINPANLHPNADGQEAYEEAFQAAMGS